MVQIQPGQVRARNKFGHFSETAGHHPPKSCRVKVLIRVDMFFTLTLILIVRCNNLALITSTIKGDENGKSSY